MTEPGTGAGPDAGAAAIADAAVDAALAAIAAELPLAPPPLALDAELSGLRAVTTRSPSRQLASLALLSLAYGGALLALTSLRGDLRELPVAWLVVAGAAWLVGFGLPVYLAVVPRSGDVLPRVQLAAASTAIMSVVFVVLGLLVHPMGVHTASYGWDHLTHGTGCLGLGLATALVPVVLGALLLRGALPVGSRWIAAALGAGGGCLGGLVLHLHCHVGDALHIGLVHGGVVVVSALLAAAIVPRATDLPRS